MKRFFLFLITALMGYTLSMNAQVRLIMSGTLHMDPPPGNIGLDKQTKTSEQYPAAEVAIYPGQMMLHFSEPVSCEIQLVDMEGHAVLNERGVQKFLDNIEYNEKKVLTLHRRLRTNGLSGLVSDIISETLSTPLICFHGLLVFVTYKN